MLTVRLATAEDVEFLAPRLRAADVEELRAGTGTTPYDALMQGLEVSEPAMVGVDEEDRPVVMFGVQTVEEGLLGCVWLLGSEDVHKHALSFHRQAKHALDAFNDRWPCLFNYCDEENTVHIEWMKRLNYTFLRRVPNFGVEGKTFLEFVRVKPCVNPYPQP